MLVFLYLSTIFYPNSEIPFFQRQLFTITLSAQDKEANPFKFRWGFDSTYRVFELDSFRQSSILTGFQWGSTINMDNALLNNSTSGHGYGEVPAGSRIYPQQVINQPSYWDRGYWGTGICNAPFMQYEPTLELDANNIDFTGRLF